MSNRSYADTERCKIYDLPRPSDVIHSDPTISRAVEHDVAQLAPEETVIISILVQAHAEGYVPNVAHVTAAGGEDYSEALLTVVAAEEEFVPEPGSLLLLSGGLAGLAGYATLRRRQRN